MISYYILVANKIKPYFVVVWKSTKKIKAIDLLRERPYDENYFKRNEDDLIEKYWEDGNNILIIGMPLDGKTRAVFELFNKIKHADILIPRYIDIKAENFIFPKPWRFLNKIIVFIDDLQRFVELQNYDYMIKSIVENNLQIISTCRSGIDLKKVRSKFQEKNIDLDMLFNKFIVIKNIEEETAKEIAKKSEIDWVTINFNGTIGSIFMQLNEIKKRYIECNEIEKTILQGIKKLFICGIYYERHCYILENIKTVCKIVGLEMKDFEWDKHITSLLDKQLIYLSKNNIRCEEVYTEYIFKLSRFKEDIDLFEELILTFSDDGDALIRIGDKAQINILDKLAVEEWEKKSIKAYEMALELFPCGLFPDKYAEIKWSLGSVYYSFNLYKSNPENCKKAINSYKESLRVCSPQMSAIIQSDLGDIYVNLAEIESKSENSNKAIKAYKESLKHYTYESDAEENTYLHTLIIELNKSL